MAASAPAFDLCGVRVVQDPVKGKVVRSERPFAPGHVIFREQAFVAASWSTDVCSKCEELPSSGSGQASSADSGPGCECERTGTPKPMYSSKLQATAGRRAVVVNVMKTVDGIDEVDRARCILKCLAMYERDVYALDEVLSLAWAAQQRAMDAALQLRRQLPGIFPQGFSDAQMARLIGVLNTNAHELETLGGSGLFLSACRMEHSCRPNCSFTTFDSTLWVTAIRAVAPGDALSIDYGNFFYRPTLERRESLLDSYGFVCTCEACVTTADPTRAVHCVSGTTCSEGLMLPSPVRNSTVAGKSSALDHLQFEWRCQTCGTVADAGERTRILAAEQELIENEFPQSLDEVDLVVRRRVLHERHYLLFWALDSIGCEAAGRATAQRSRQELSQVWQRIIACMNVVVPAAHHEKIIYYDNLAQVQVVLGDLAAASRAYARAYETSCLVSGTDCSPTRKLLRLMETPPKTAEELRQLYAAEAQHRQRPSSDVEDEDTSDDE
ncbi:unnamed protein product [Hyaloperonospora brassicae]|uniref:SET domain-containing protein n=1 Tax=Hyaloperonospora brassicae TaxID=162125 RepID=A0AAV0TII3_HYABA|nr:unnamed protein product [Hyaloperonospora brassicae]